MEESIASKKNLLILDEDDKIQAFLKRYFSFSRRYYSFFLKYNKYMEGLPIKNPLKDFLSLSLDRCMQAVNARSGSIFILDTMRNELVLEIARNPQQIGLEGIRARLGEGVAGRVALERRPFLVEDIDNEPTLRTFPRFDHYQSKSFLSVPLDFSGDVIGVINLTDKETGLSFDDTDLQSVVAICKYLGVALYSLTRYVEKQQQMNEELTKELEEIRESMEKHKKFSSLGKFVGGLVHEINNPLDGVIRYINLTLDTMPESEVSKEYLLNAKDGLTRIVRFVRSLLDFSWSMSPTGREIDINRALEESLYQYSYQFSNHNIKVEKVLGASVPRLPDYGIRIVFNNIIKNACEAMKEKGGTLRILTACVDGVVEILFVDTGPGIPTEVRRKIFDPFFTTKNMGEGSGLGLAISAEIMQRYGGDIAVESEAGKGTAITVVLPIRTDAEKTG